jgi:hypothetical protein
MPFASRMQEEGRQIVRVTERRIHDSKGMFMEKKPY